MGIAEGFDPIIEHGENYPEEPPLGVMHNLDDAKWDATPQEDHASIAPWPTQMQIPHPLPPLDEMGDVQLTALPPSNYVYPDPLVELLRDPRQQLVNIAPRPVQPTIKKKKVRAPKPMPSFTLTPDQVRLQIAIQAQAALRKAQSEPRSALRPAFSFTFGR